MRLNIGAGPWPPDGWVAIDPNPAYPAAFHSDVISGLPLESASAEGAVAHHVLQMVAWPDLVPWLTEVRRVLRPGAWLRLSVPDLRQVHRWLDPGWPSYRFDPPPIADEHEASIDGKVCLWVSQAGATRSVFTGGWLAELLQRAGYARTQVCGFGDSGDAPPWLTELDAHPDRRTESAYVQGQAL